MRAQPERYELHFEDETHRGDEPAPEPRLAPHRRATNRPGGGHQPAADRLRQCGGVGTRPGGGAASAAGLGRVCPVLGRARCPARGDRTATSSWCWTTALPRQQDEPAALADRADWLEVIPLARYSPHLNPKEREWRILKRDHCGHLAPTLRDFVDAVAAGLQGLGGDGNTIVDEVPSGGWTATARHLRAAPRGRPMGAKDHHPPPAPAASHSTSTYLEEAPDDRAVDHHPDRAVVSASGPGDPALLDQPQNLELLADTRAIATLDRCIRPDAEVDVP